MKGERDLCSAKNRVLQQVGTLSMALNRLSPGRFFCGMQLLTRRVLPAIFVERHQGGGGNVVGIGHAPDGNFHHSIQQRQALVRKPLPFRADNKSCLFGEGIVGKTGGVCCLLQSNEGVALLLQLFQNGRQAIFDGEVHMLRTIAGNFADELGIAGCDDFLDPATACGPEDGRILCPLIGTFRFPKNRSQPRAVFFVPMECAR